MDNQEVIETLKTLCHTCKLFPRCAYEKPECFKAINMAISALQEQELSETQNSLDTISRQAAIDAFTNNGSNFVYGTAVCKAVVSRLKQLPSAQPEIVRCKDCEYGEQDEVGRWFCRSLGCQIGSEDGSGFCADAERRTDG